MHIPPRLERSLLKDGHAVPENVACGTLKRSPEKILQFGEGNFLRAFVDWMVDEANSQGVFEGSVAIVQPLASGLAGKLNEQDGLYTLVARGIESRKVVETRRIITSVSRALNPYEQWAGVIELARSPHLRFVVSNTTEAGIEYVPEPFAASKCPNSFPAKVTALLYERYRVFGGDDSSGLVFLPCELIDRNGRTLRECVLKYAEDWNCGDGFISWLNTANYFLNTLVDRIVPGYPRAEADSFAAQLGYTDELLDSAEIFHLWVIEGPRHLARELPLHEAGMNVVWTDDMSPYRTRKVRILNGAHTASVLAAFLGGVNTVRDMMADPLFGRFIRHTVFEEIVPSLSMEENEKRDYAAAVLERFQNPFIEHQLLSIALNSVSKWKVRVLPSVVDYHAAWGKLPPLLVFSLAALIRFYKTNTEVTAEATGNRRAGEDGSYPIRDNPEIIDFFRARWQAFGSDGDFESLVVPILANETFWGRDLNRLPGMAEAVIAAVREILRDGTRAAAESLLPQ